jgi:hypothetical protein
MQEPGRGIWHGLNGLSLLLVVSSETIREYGTVTVNQMRTVSFRIFANKVSRAEFSANGAALFARWLPMGTWQPLPREYWVEKD